MQKLKFKKSGQLLVVSILLASIFITNFGMALGQQSSTKIVALGDSITLGTGATSGNGYVSVLSRRIGQPIINAGLSGDSTAEALARLDRDVLSHDPDIVIVFLGGADILDRVPQATTFENLRQIIERIQDSGAEVILVGVHGSVFLSGLEDDYRDLALSTGASHVPNVFMGILGNPFYMSDLVHPNDRGHELIADRILPVLQNTLRSVSNQELIVVCEADANTIFLGKRVIWSTTVTGGEGNYRYEWSGSDGLTGSNSRADITYGSSGTKNAQVRVISGSQSKTISCPSIVVSAPVLVGSCSVNVLSDGTGGYIVNWGSTFDLLGSSTTTTYEWSGTDSASGNNPSLSQTYTTGGLKRVTVRARAGGETLELTCTANIPNSNFGTSTDSFIDGIGGSCIPSVSGKTVYWNATQFGGRGENGGFSWSGTDGLTSTSPSPVQVYETEGIKEGAVVISSGGESITLTCQAKVADIPEGGGGGCFIATVAFGTEMEPEVMILRKFRDEKLLTNAWGEKFVEFYYKVSPPVADFIRDKERTKAVVRTGLQPLLFVSNLLLEP